jgi:hypothetical protein
MSIGLENIGKKEGDNKDVFPIIASQYLFTFCLLHFSNPLPPMHVITLMFVSNLLLQCKLFKPFMYRALPSPWGPAERSVANGRRREKEAHDNGRESCQDEMNSHLSLEGRHPRKKNTVFFFRDGFILHLPESNTFYAFRPNTRMEEGQRPAGTSKRSVQLGLYSY